MQYFEIRLDPVFMQDMSTLNYVVKSELWQNSGSVTIDFIF